MTDPTSPVTSPVQLRTMMERAWQAQKDADELASTVRDIFLAAMRNIVQPGDVLDLNIRKCMPEYLIDLHTTRGNDRGSKLFEVVRVFVLSYDARSPSLSKWGIEAMPIGKSGKVISGAAGNTSGPKRTTVTLTGSLGSGGDLVDHVNETVAQHLTVSERITQYNAGLDRLATMIANHLVEATPGAAETTVDTAPAA